MGGVAVTSTALPALATGREYHTGATDTRGNWLLAAEIAAPSVVLMPGSFPSSFPGSGTYTLQAGGPDTLTPATVHALTGYAGNDLWGIGAY